jgi:hypothetical protein
MSTSGFIDLSKSGFGTKRFLLIFPLLCAMLISVSASAETIWPAVALPADVQSFEVGEQISVNGIPVRIQGFLSHRSPDDLAQWFHQKMGEPLMDNRIGNKRILGRMQGDAYITVQLEQAGSGSRGVVAVTQTTLAQKNQQKTRELNQRWLSRMPPGSQLQSQVLSQDGKRHSAYMSFSNSYSIRVNRDAVLKALENEDYQPEDMQSQKDVQSSKQLAQSLYFRGKNKQAMVLIKPAKEGGTIIVLNLVNTLEQLR